MCVCVFQLLTRWSVKAVAGVKVREQEAQETSGPDQTCKGFIAAKETNGVFMYAWVIICVNLPPSPQPFFL